MVSMIFILSFGCKEKVVAPNTLTDEEKAEGWVLLFDGQTSNGWRGVNKDHFPTNWEIVDGTLHCKESGQGEKGEIRGSSTWVKRWRDGPFT